VTKSVEVVLAGLKLSVNTDDNPDQVWAAADMVQTQFEELKRSGTIIDTSKIMALIALNLADELLSKEGLSDDMQALISKLDLAVSQADTLANVSLR